jgi:antitoxin ParD1/3/4
MEEMTVRTSIAFTDEQHRLAQRLVEEGRFASVSAVVAHGLRLLLQEQEEQAAVLAGLTETIRERAATPAEAFVDLPPGSVRRQAERTLRAAPRTKPAGS